MWFDKLREYGVGPGAKLLRDTGMVTTGLCVGGLLSEIDVVRGNSRVDENTVNATLLEHVNVFWTALESCCLTLKRLA